MHYYYYLLLLLCCNYVPHLFGVHTIAFRVSQNNSNEFVMREIESERNLRFLSMIGVKSVFLVIIPETALFW